jgi:predicted nucleic acid-binding protein
MARSESTGQPIEARDAFIAATAEVHGLTLVTRNTSDFEPTLKSDYQPLDLTELTRLY